MKIAPVAEVKAKLSQYLEDAAQNGPVVITRNGRAVGVLLATQDDDEIERLILAHSSRFQALLEQSRQSVRDGQGLTSEAFWDRVDHSS